MSDESRDVVQVPDSRIHAFAAVLVVCTVGDHADGRFARTYPRKADERLVDRSFDAGVFANLPPSILRNGTRIAVVEVCVDGRSERADLSRSDKP